MPSLEEIKSKIRAEVRMFSGCDDSQTSADVSNVSDFQLPDPKGKAGGACTSTMLNVLYEDETKPEDDLSFYEVLMKMRENLKENGFSQIPQLSSSRPMNLTDKFDIVPDKGFKGKKRAVLIGINYKGHAQGELSGCHNDVHNMVKYIKDVHGFEDENITLLLDDDENTPPTYENIIDAYRELVKKTKPGDAVFCHYSGHGGRVKDDDGDEDDGFDETLVPLDYSSAGQIRDDELLIHLVCAMPEDVTLTCIMDCCHSGTVLDLPFNFTADGESEEMKESEKFDFDKLPSIFPMASSKPSKKDESDSDEDDDEDDDEESDKEEETKKQEDADSVVDDKDKNLNQLMSKYNRQAFSELKGLVEQQNKMQRLAYGIQKCEHNAFEYRLDEDKKKKKQKKKKKKKNDEDSDEEENDGRISSEYLIREILFSFQQNRGFYLPSNAYAGSTYDTDRKYEFFRDQVGKQIEDCIGVTPKIKFEERSEKDKVYSIWYS